MSGEDTDSKRVRAFVQPFPAPPLSAEAGTSVTSRPFSLHLDVESSSQVLQTNERLYHLAPASLVDSDICTARPLRSTDITPPLHYYGPSRHRLVFDGFPGFGQLYHLPCSTDFSMGRGRFLQLLSMPLSPCYPYHPAEVTYRIGQSAPRHAAFASKQRARPSGLNVSRLPLGSLSLRPGDSLTTPRAALSVGFIRFVSSTNATQATGPDS